VSAPSPAAARPPLGSPTLLLVPTALEERRLSDAGGLPAGLALRALCGFGPIAAAARTAELVGLLRPRRVVLVGICGTYDTERFPVGAAREFDAVAIEGIGVGEGERALAPPALGFPQWPGREETGTPSVDERLELAPLAPTGGGEAALLLTTCSASDTDELTARRRRRFPEALAEDMEAFGVALACTLSGTPLSVVRGASNVAGDRDPSRWRIPAALSAARALLVELLERA
jgi:futalosine hydrolase